MSVPAISKRSRGAGSRAAGLRIAGIGRVCTWEGGSIWIGRESGRVGRHAHHAIQITLALDAPHGAFLLRAAGQNRWRKLNGAVVMPHRPHEFDGCDGTIAQIFLEPETDQGRVLLERFGRSDISELPSEIQRQAANVLAARFAARASATALVADARAVIDALAGQAPVRRTLDARIAAAVDVIAHRAAAPLSLVDVARAVHLSPGRLRHLFVEQTGTTFRAYLLWLRINRAVNAMMNGSSWTEAAHFAGFADSAHLSRTFRRMFGVSPGMLIKE